MHANGESEDCYSVLGVDGLLFGFSKISVHVAERSFRIGDVHWINSMGKQKSKL